MSNSYHASLLTATASENLSDVLNDVFHHDDSHKALVIYDLDSILSRTLTEAYRTVLPKGNFINLRLKVPWYSVGRKSSSIVVVLKNPKST